MSEFQDVLFSTERDHGRIMLNRPQAMNALTLAMIDAIDTQLQTWETRPDLKAIIITGAGDKIFCAGGDLKAIYAAKQRGDLGFLEDFYRHEYTLNHRVATYAKPIIAIMDGVVMGGGAGIALNCSHPVVTHRTLFAMPECRIGLFPDVGAGHFLGRCSPALGLAIGLTSLTLGGPGVLRAGLAKYFVGSGRVAEIGIGNLDAFNLPVSAAGLDQVLPNIESVFGLKTLDEIMTVLSARRDAWAVETVRALRRFSPLSLKVTFAHLTRARGQKLADVLKTEFRLAQHFVAGHDFFEGVRAHMIDKDGAPEWRPAKVADVTPAMVAAYFAPVPGVPDWAPQSH